MSIKTLDKTLKKNYIDIWKYLNLSIYMNQRTLKVFRALSNKTRAEIIKKLLSQKEISCQQLSRKFSLSQPTLSHHFNKLIDANILKLRKNGVSHYYSIDKKYLRNMGIIIEKIIN